MEFLSVSSFIFTNFQFHSSHFPFGISFSSSPDACRFFARTECNRYVSIPNWTFLVVPSSDTVFFVNSIFAMDFLMKFVWTFSVSFSPILFLFVFRFLNEFTWLRWLLSLAVYRYTEWSKTMRPSSRCLTFVCQSINKQTFCFFVQRERLTNTRSNQMSVQFFFCLDSNKPNRVERRTEKWMKRESEQQTDSKTVWENLTLLRVHLYAMKIKHIHHSIGNRERKCYKKLKGKYLSECKMKRKMEKT